MDVSLVIMFKRLVDTSRFNDDEHDMTEVPKQALNVLLDYLFNFFITVSSLYLLSLINSLPNVYIVMCRSAY